MHAARYTVRPHPRSNQLTYSLAAEGLQIESNDSSRPKRLIPWADIARVELFYTPESGASRRFACKLNLRSGAAETFFSSSYVEYKTYTDQSDSFTAFVHQLHQALAHNAPNCKFGRKSIGWLQLARISFASTCILFQLLILLLLWNEGAPSWSYILVILPGLALLPLFYQLFRGDLHGKYQPNAIPKHLLP